MSKIINRKPTLTGNQFERLANIFDNAGQVVLGILVTVGCWLVSMRFAGKGA